MGTVSRFVFGFCFLMLGLVGLLGAGAQPAPVPQFIAGTCVSVVDGDTIEVAAQGTRYRVRLHGIDSPETDQPGAPSAKKFTESLVLGKQVTVRGREWDQYHRLVGRVFQGLSDVSVSLVQSGNAWHYTEYSNETVLADAQREAQLGQRGLWRDLSPIPPWKWRDGYRGESNGLAPTPVVIVGSPPVPSREKAHGDTSRTTPREPRAEGTGLARKASGVAPCHPAASASVLSIYPCGNDHHCVEVEVSANECCGRGSVTVRLYYADRGGPRLLLSRDTTDSWSLTEGTSRGRIEVDTFVYTRVYQALEAQVQVSCSDR